jgi:hypothetical protein
VLIRSHFHLFHDAPIWYWLTITKCCTFA